MHTELIHGIEAAGFHYKSPESPDLWTYLESHFTGPDSHVGPKFGNFSASGMEAMIARGEEALLKAMNGNLKRTGKPGCVTETIEMPYVVGTAGVVALKDVEADHVLRLVDYAGTGSEHIVRVIMVEADAIPCTNWMTVTGGLYSDGHTAGYYDLRPGAPVDSGSSVYLATAGDIRKLARDMDAEMDSITVASRRECESMLAQVKKLLG